MTILRIQKTLETLFRKVGDVEVLGISTLENDISIYYTINGEVKIYTDGVNKNGTDRYAKR